MRISLPTLFLLACCLPTIAAKDEDPSKAKPQLVQELKVKARLPFAGGRVNNPKTITSEKELAKALPKEVAATLAKQVDFSKQEIIYFAWGGSGRDTLGAKVVSEKEGKIVFDYKPGLTRDLRSHHHFFAVRKGTKWKVETNRRRRG